MDAPLRIAFHAECLLARPLTGVGQYAAALLEALAQRPDVRMVPFTRAGPYDGAEAAPVPALAARPAGARRYAGVLRRFVPPAVRRARRHWRARRAMHALAADLYHDPNNLLLPGFGIPEVLTVHDLSVRRFPQWHPPERIAQFARHFDASVARARMIVTHSECVRQELIAELGVAADRVAVAPLAAGPAFRPCAPETVRPVLARFGLHPGGYVLFVGTREPRKNLDALLTAWERLSQAVRGARRLVLAGPAGWRSEALEQRLDHAERAGLVARLGYVPDADRPALYTGADAFLYVSLYEGFGLPPLEAAACGAPVVTSAGTPMAETLGGVAELVDPSDPAAIGEGVRRALLDEDWRMTARRAGPERAARYSWQACAGATVAAYRGALR